MTSTKDMLRNPTEFRVLGAHTHLSEFRANKQDFHLSGGVSAVVPIPVG